MEQERKEKGEKFCKTGICLVGKKKPQTKKPQIKNTQQKKD